MHLQLIKNACVQLSFFTVDTDKSFGCITPCSSYSSAHQDITTNPKAKAEFPFQLELPDFLIRVETTRAVTFEGV